MTQLNRKACEAMLRYDVSACTDITGNALLGHAWEMAKASNVAMEFELDAVPFLPGTMEAVEGGHLTGGEKRNRDYVEGGVDWSHGNEKAQHVLYDPQTSGGLLICVAKNDAEKLLNELKPAHPFAGIVGRTTSSGTPAIRVV